MVGSVVLGVAGYAAGPLKDVTVVRAMVASKREFFEDEQVKRIMMAHGYEVQVTPVGSLDLAEKVDLDSYHFVFPSGQSAADRIRERRRGKHAIAFRPFFSPIVLATFRDYADALFRAGVARPQGDPTLYYDLEMGKLVGLIDRKAVWSEFGLKNGNRITAQAPDACRTYSGAVYVGLVSFARTGHPPENEADAVAIARAIKPLFDVEGQHGEDMAPKYFAPEGRTFAPVAVLYEHQFIAHQIRSRQQTGRLDDSRVLLYPAAQHQTAPELISQSPEGDAIGHLIMENDQLRRRAVELGFHVLSPGDTPVVDFADLLRAHDVPIPTTGVGDTETWLPANEVFRAMIKEIGRCTW
ncbi:hypothetical protein LWC34_49810 [Kibdelosporangium philippinense]|uniref:Uncharacterized protein n=1 Tax=Kibdelosporangium philippinense TaxID=211113 RepID=A0ABS8ZSZ3_9PSEU|nr:hypothetical protein [Kibdelosporangium philippinense]MCE7010849.1 hypothetical protein [Kibdelosporangium philippinense]